MELSSYLGPKGNTQHVIMLEMTVARVCIIARFDSDRRYVVLALSMHTSLNFMFSEVSPSV